MTLHSFLKTPELSVVQDAESLSRAAASEFCRAAEAAIAAHGRFTVALSGGNTPRAAYSLLATEHKDSLPWEKIFIFFGDERHVPPDHPDSNYRMAQESLLSHVPIPQANVFRIQAEFPADIAAHKYEDRLREFFRLPPGSWPRFDLVFLGLGDDGHTASLFPGTVALDENTRLVAANWVEKFNTFRITFTFPVLNHAAEVLFLVSGAGKAPVMKEIFSNSVNASFPAQRVRPEQGRLLWMADRPATSLL
jgi:6-phosphogluconolactonase